MKRFEGFIPAATSPEKIAALQAAEKLDALKGRFGLKGTGFSLKGMGFSPYIHATKINGLCRLRKNSRGLKAP